MSVLENINLDLNSSIFVLTGAGISAESGIQTFRASTGLWNQHKIDAGKRHAKSMENDA